MKIRRIEAEYAKSDMKIAVNTLAHRSTGGGITYLENILPRISETSDRIILFVPEGRGVFERFASNHSQIEIKEVTPLVRMAPLLVFYEQIILPLRLLLMDVDLLFSPTDTTSILAPCPVVLAIQNPNPFSPLARFSRWDKIKFLVQRVITKASARRAQRVVFVSKTSRKASNEILQLPTSKTEIIYHGVDKKFVGEGSEGSSSEVRSIVTSSDYILCISTIREHKNFESLIRGYAELPQHVRNDYNLIIAGRVASHSYYDMLIELVDELNINDRVIFLGEVADSDIAYLYENASVYVLPSKLETFGLTLVEAMANDLPIVASHSAAIPEIAGDAALYFDPDSPGELADQLTKVLTDADIRVALLEANDSRIDEFSWDRNAGRLRTLFEVVNSDTE